MAYAGYLIKIGTYELPMKYIKAESYTPYRSVLDLDAERDANGCLHRNALDHVPAKVEWETPAMLTNDEFGNMMNAIRAQFTNVSERKAIVSLFIPELNDYVEQEMYMPDIKPTIYGVKGMVIKYNSIRLAFIGY